MGLAEPRLVPLGSAQQPLKEHGEEFMEEEEKLNFKLEEIFGAGTNCPAMGLAEIHLEPLGLVKKNLKARGRVLNGKELGQK